MKILLVDDSRATEMLMRARLESFDYEVVHAIDGQTAIELFSKSHFDLILMDVEMPGMNGFETTSRIRALEGKDVWAWTPIMFVTATDTNTNLITAIEAGGDDFISKNVPEDVLRAKMKAMSRTAGLRARLALANRKLQEQANCDGLTGLLNRRAMDQLVDGHWERACSQKQSFALLMIDVDNFKNFNDIYGHLSGDECLGAVAKCLIDKVRQLNGTRSVSNVFAARYGGEEFAVVIPDAAEGIHLSFAEILVKSVAALAIPHSENGEHGVVTVSIGAVRVSPAAGELHPVFRNADALLYKAKKAGRNRYLAV